ncbi:MAG: hypothetical protein WC860_07970, partial [Candidatus Margulisiibacteriota bacterium]
MDPIRVISIILTICIAISCTFLAKSEKIRHFAEQLSNLKQISYSQMINNTVSFDSSIKLLSGKLMIYPIKNKNYLFDFSAKYKLNQVRPQITFSNNQNLAKLSIKQNELKIYGLLSRSRWNLGLNPHIINNLKIETVSAKEICNLSGLKIKNLSVKTVSGLVTISFFEDNPIIMDTFIFKATESSNCTLKGLLRSRAKKIAIFCNGGNLLLDFSGQLLIPTEVQINGNVKKIKIIIPKGINTTIFVPNLKKIKVNVTNLIKEGEFTFTNTEFNPLFSSLKINLLINT